MTDRPLVLLLSGPNLNLLGEREPEVYGTASLDDHVRSATAAAEALGLAVELHISNPSARESWRQLSVISPVASGVIAGFGGRGYDLAMTAMAGLLGR